MNCTCGLDKAVGGYIDGYRWVGGLVGGVCVGGINNSNCCNNIFFDAL